MPSADPPCGDAGSLVRSLRGFYQHGLTSVVVIGFLTALNLTARHYGGTQWIAFGRGTGLGVITRGQGMR